MNVIKGCIIAFSLFSKIPMPFIKWERESLKYVYCFLPLVGCVIGVLEVLVYFVCTRLGINTAFRAALLTALPILLTGGIHLDGFMDAEDALCSGKSKDELLKIMDDPHIGAFAVIRLAVLLILYFGAFCGIASTRQIYAAAIGLVCVRGFACEIIASVPCAKSEGMLYTFVSAMSRPMVILFTVVWIMSSIAALGALLQPWIIPAALGLIIWNILFEKMVKKRFGGISGDTLGLFISVAEVLLLIIIAFSEASI